MIRPKWDEENIFYGTKNCDTLKAVFKLYFSILTLYFPFDFHTATGELFRYSLPR